MTPRRSAGRAAAVLALLAAIACQPVVAACKTGFVPRLATPLDDVCVPPGTRARTVTENARAPLLWTPGVFGPKTCVQGYVWRAARPEDTVCVTGDVRTEAQVDNSLAPDRRQ